MSAAIFTGVWVAVLLDRFWPWGWDGKRKSLKLRSRRKDWL